MDYEVLKKLPFDDVPTKYIVSAFGVKYVHLSPREGGDLYITSFGWPLVEQLLPNNWYHDKWYYQNGQKLLGATSQVYRVNSKPINGISADLVVKFSRVAQDVPLIVNTTFPDNISPEDLAAARFNSPMEEFGLLMELRNNCRRNGNKRMYTQKPYAIYVPPEEVKLWQLGRDESRFRMHKRKLLESQNDVVKAIELDIKRQYVLLYGWIKGKDAQLMNQDNLMDKKELEQLTIRVINELKENGYRVLDNKPKHFILRKSKNKKELIREKDDKLIYGLIDFELLQRTPEYQRRFKIEQSQKFRKLLKQPDKITEKEQNHPLNVVQIYGTDYVFGATQDGGYLWVVGNNRALFDYFVPDRWRRTDRIKLSLKNEVYRTQTRDNIYVVYRRSNIGSKPRIDPLDKNSSKIRQHGYNSPFEEIHIAQTLKHLGINTTLPLAVYRTGHQTTKTAFLRDNSRFQDLSAVEKTMQITAPVFSADYDYYTIWDNFNGFENISSDSVKYVIDIDHAAEQNIINLSEKDEILERAEKVLFAKEFDSDFLTNFVISIFINEEDRVVRNSKNQIEATISFDALTAFELNLINQKEYLSIFNRLKDKLLAADCEKPDLKGHHLLLSINLNHEFIKDADGEIATTLCNFEFIRGLYRSFR